MQKNNTHIPLPNNSFSEIFNCDKMKSLISGHPHMSFSEKFSNWIKSYTKSTREKIWVDIESYKAG